ncbi:MAG: zinc ribbon-containing protein [Sulfuricella sp.]
MKGLPPSHDPMETLGEAYEVLLGKALQKAHQSGAALHHVIGEVRGDTPALNKLKEEDVVKLEGYVKRDLIDAARYRDKTGKALQDWLGFDLTLIKHEFLEMFSAAADKTTTELLLLKMQAENAEYHTGELTGLGTLVCDQCGEKLHFHKPGHIPPCPKCNSTHFHRQNFE